jgi:hypothetical protein
VAAIWQQRSIGTAGRRAKRDAPPSVAQAGR